MNIEDKLKESRLNSVIRQMFFGEKGTCDSINFTEDYYKFLDEVIEYDDELRNKLALMPKLFEAYRKASDAISKLNRESEIIHYTEGFKLGVLLGMELTHDF